jgi:hypothetical protein
MLARLLRAFVHLTCGERDTRRATSGLQVLGDDSGLNLNAYLAERRVWPAVNRFVVRLVWSRAHQVRTNIASMLLRRTSKLELSKSELVPSTGSAYVGQFALRADLRQRPMVRAVDPGIDAHAVDVEKIDGRVTRKIQVLAPNRERLVTLGVSSFSHDAPSAVPCHSVTEPNTRWSAWAQQHRRRCRTLPAESHQLRHIYRRRRVVAYRQRSEWTMTRSGKTGRAPT